MVMVVMVLIGGGGVLSAFDLSSPVPYSVGVRAATPWLRAGGELRLT